MSPLFSRKKRKIIPKYRIQYGKSPSLNRKVGNKNYQTPTKKRKLPQSKFKKGLKRLTILSLILLIFYALFFSNYLKVDEIVVAEETFDKETLTQEIRASLSENLGENIIFLDTSDLELKVNSLFPELEKISVEKDYPSKLIVDFSQFPLVANVINESISIKKSYIINSVGYAIKEDLENPSLPYIRVQSDEPINTENPIIEKSKLTYVLDTISYFEDKFGMNIKEVQYKKIPRELHLLTEKDFYIWLDIQRPAEEQLKKLKKSLIKLDIYSEPLEYIDLRIAGSNGDKIIYKRLN